MAITESAAVSKFSRIVNKATKWAVTGMAGAVVLWRHDELAIWAVTGAALNGANAKVLKKLIRQERPITAAGLKSDKGMPSTHAQSLSFLSTYASLGIFQLNGLNWGSVILTVLILGCATYMAYLRIANGLHTHAQVAVGAGLGCISALVWNWFWAAYVERSVAQVAWVSPALWVVFLVAAIIFLFEARKWRITDF